MSGPRPPAEQGPAQSERLLSAWRSRREELARRRGRDALEPAVAQAVLPFRLGSQRYAFALTDLAGVRAFQRCTPVPGAPAELLGVINHHGLICCVLDLGRLLGLAPPDPHEGEGYVLLLRGREREVGLKVDAVEAVRLLRADELASPEGVSRFARALTCDGLVILARAPLLAHPVFHLEQRP